MAWYCDGQSTTSNSSPSHRKFSGLPTMTSSHIFPREYCPSLGLCRGTLCQLFQAAQRDPHCCWGASEHQVDVAAAVHEDAAHLESSDLCLITRAACSG